MKILSNENYFENVKNNIRDTIKIKRPSIKRTKLYVHIINIIRFNG